MTSVEVNELVELTVKVPTQQLDHIETKGGERGVSDQINTEMEHGRWDSEECEYRVVAGRKNHDGLVRECGDGRDVGVIHDEPQG